MNKISFIKKEIVKPKSSHEKLIQKNNKTK